MLLVSLTYLISSIVLFLGVRFGGKPERLATVAIFTWLIVDPLYRTAFPTTEFSSIDWALFAFDVLLAGALTGIALNANRVWPIFAAAFSILPVLSHVAVLIGHDNVRQAYWALNQLPFPFVLLALLSGISAQRQRRASGINCRDWSR